MNFRAICVVSRKDPVLECTHKNVEKCHFTYKTIFTPVQEQVKNIFDPARGESRTILITLFLSLSKHYKTIINNVTDVKC